MKKYAILSYLGEGMAKGSAPNEPSPARLNIGERNSLERNHNGTSKDLIRDENETIIQFNTQVHALNYCIEKGWNLEQTIFESGEGFNARNPLSAYIFILSKEV